MSLAPPLPPDDRDGRSSPLGRAPRVGDAGTARLERAFDAARERGDGAALCRLWTRAADLAEGRGDIDRTCFFLTQAWVTALAEGLDEADGLERRLVRHGRSRGARKTGSIG